MHEFGHTFGLGHGASTDGKGNKIDNIMNLLITALSGPSDNDLKAARSIYEYHAPH